MKQSTFSAFVANSIKNLLQGYTKGIRITAILILLLMGVSNAWALDFTQGTVVYFDNTLTQWSKIYLRVGHGTYNSAYQVSTKVSGTQNLYKYTIPSWGGYEAFSFANSQGWTNSNSIYQPTSSVKPTGTYAITGQTEYFKWNLDKMRLFIPKSKSNSEQGCQYYNTDVEYNNYQRTVTIKTPTNGTITVTYKNENNANQTKTSGDFKVAQTCIITVTATPNAGYELSSLTVGGSAFTSGNTYVVRGDIEISATFSAKTYTVTLENQGATTAGAASVTATYNAAMPSIANNLPKKTGYTFNGYFDAESGGNQYYKADGTSARTWNKTSNTTLYAQWTITNYNITYENLNGVTHANPATYNIETPTIIFTNPTSERTGYDFDGWNPASIETGSTGNTTITAQWTAKTNTVTLNQEEATAPGIASVTATYDAAMPSITTPTRIGYTFGGYWTEKEGQGTQYYKADGTSAKDWDQTSNITLYAQWIIKQYTITYGVVGSANGTIQLDGGTEVNTSSSATANYNTNHTFTAEPANDYKIEGWYSDANGANKIDAAGTNDTYEIASLTADTYVYVKFVEAAEVMSQVTVGATEGGAVSPSGTVEVGNKTSSTFTATPAPGYRFDHWTYSEDIVKETESNTDEQGSITITATSTGTLTANFVRVYTVNFFATPAAAGIATATVNDDAINSGDEFGAGTEITFTATPHTQCNFIKWVDGTGTELSTNATYTHTVTDDITVKGIFTINQYILTFSAGDGGFVSAKANNSAIASPANLDYNTSVTLTAEPSANCVFNKWVDENGNEIKEGNKSIGATYTFNLTANKTVKATFTKGTTIFFKPVDYWKEADARFAVYTWGGSAGDKWIEFEDYSCNEDIFTADIPAGYTGFKIVRLKPASADGYNSDGDGFNWDNRWAETVNLTIPNGDKNLYDMTVTKASTKLYFTPHGNWKEADARFAAYFFGNGNNWVDLTHHNDGIYACDKPSGYTKVIFGRMNPGIKENNFNNGVKWNQTGDIVIPTNGQNHYILTGGEWDGVTGEWHTAWDDRQWTTYAAPAYNLSIKTPEYGTIAVSKVGGGALDNNAAIKLGDKITITFTPNDGYELSNYLINYASETETDGVYTVCGPTKIIAEFDPIAPSRTVYLRPNEDWLRDNPIMAARVRKSSGGNDKWYVMNTTSEDYTGAYSCNIPNDYDKIIFVRLNPKGSDAANDGFNWTNAWNQTKELTIIDKDNDATNDKKLRFAIGNKIETSGEDYGRYDGKWEENTPIWGLIANFNDWKAENAVFMGYPGKLNTVPPFTPQHAFKLYNFIYTDGKYFGNAGTMKRENSEQWWTMDVNEQANCQMKLDAKGDYIYQLRFLTVGPELRKQISVTYPEATNVYTLLYEYTIDSQTKSRMSYEIAAVAGEKLDTVSFHVLKNASPQITLLKNSERQEEPISISVESDSVYNFVLQQTDGQARLLNAANPEVYTGNYYVRTDAATGGWNAYKQAGNKMTYSSYADKNQSFDHYYCKWVESPETGDNRTNVKFCVANDYSHALSDELNGDEIIEKVGIATGCLPDSVNVRFAWDSQTNELSRAYISGSAYAKDRFLVLTGNEYLLDIDSTALNVSGLKANEALFADKQNWIYQLDVQANNNTEITLTAKYNNKVQTFLGTSKSGLGGEPIMQATNEDYHKVRMIYDFKTNNLIAAWLLDETQYPETTSVASNMLIIREDQDVANQINFSNINNDDMTIQTAYAVMTFTRDHVTDKDLNQWQRSEYWVSFPFDVKISDVFGFSEYGDKWIMQLYDGAERAEKGNWIDSPTFWKYITNRNYTLKAGVGYVLKLNLNKMDFPNNSTDASLFFPSQGIPTVINAEPTSITVPAHECTIERDNRNIHDSHWNLIGVPGYANLNDVNTKYTTGNQAENVSFYYAYNAAENKYAPAAAEADFKNMYAYMVQFAGTIDWKNNPQFNNIPQQLAARRNSDTEPEKRTLRLELAQDEVMADQTFVQLQQEGATAEFDMNLDLTKIINSGANIYTLAGEQRIQSAGNALPMGEAIVPVGVKIDAEGEYTFRMPDGTEGMVVELIDYERDITTNLLLFDYTVTLPAGSNESRFALHIQPNKSGVTTGVEEAYPQPLPKGKGAKFLIDGKLVIRTAEGVIYDAQGHRL